MSDEAHGSPSRLHKLRELMLSAEVRPETASLVEALLAAAADLDDDESASPFLEGLARTGSDEEMRQVAGAMTVGELRESLRVTLAEIAARDAE